MENTIHYAYGIALDSVENCKLAAATGASEYGDKAYNQLLRNFMSLYQRSRWNNHNCLMQRCHSQKLDETSIYFEKQLFFYYDNLHDRINHRAGVGFI